MSWIRHPASIVFASFSAFTSGFALMDYNREVKLTLEECEEFDQHKRDTAHLGSALEQYHSLAFRDTLSYHSIRANRFRTKELYFVFTRVEKKKAELQTDLEFQGRDEDYLENFIPTEYYNFSQRMSRRAMIRNYHFVKWFKATMQDEFVKYYLIPVASYFAVRNNLNTCHYQH